jgi:hypothetical protein
MEVACMKWYKKAGEQPWEKYLTVTPEVGGEYYRLDIPKGVTPPAEGEKLNLHGVEVVALAAKSSDEIAKGRGGPVASGMRLRGVDYLVNCLPVGHERLKLMGL